MQQITLKDDITISPVMKDVYRRISTNIEFAGDENKCICITSCIQSDGKSRVSYNLARTFADNNKKVLLIDADMRNSVLHYREEYEKDVKGLSHFLSGKMGVMDVMYATNYKNFYLIPTGIFSKNPIGLLSSPRFASLIKAAKSSFDYILVDTPPLGAVVDAAVIARECDGSVLVLASDKVSRRAAQNVMEQLKQANANVLGVVLNKVDVRANGYYGKKYSYGYDENTKKNRKRREKS